MNFKWLLLMAVSASAVAASDAPVISLPAPRPRIDVEVRKRVEEKAPSLPAPTLPVIPAEVAAEKAVFTMAPVRVSASPLLIDRRFGEQLPYIKPFALETGGIISKDVGKYFTSEVKAQWDGVKSWNLLGISF